MVQRLSRELLVRATPHPAPPSPSHDTIMARRADLTLAAIELCPSRWNSSAAASWREKRDRRIPSYERLLSEDEFQEIGTTGRRLGAVLLATLGDLLTPSGWRGVAADLRLASRRLPAFARAALHGKLLAGAPLAVARYLYQSPAALPFLLLSGAALALAAAVDEATGAVATWEDGAVTTAVAVVQLVHTCKGVDSP